MTKPGATIRVMIVDDAVVVRQILKDALSRDPDIEVVGSAIDGMYAMEKLQELMPDVVVLDVEMPNMDGIETLAAIKKSRPKTRVIMFSTLTARGARATMDAMMLGADDYVTKPSNVGSVTESMERIQAELVPKIKALHGRSVAPAAPRAPGAGAAPAPAVPPAPAPQPFSQPVPAPPSPVRPRIGMPPVRTRSVTTERPQAPIAVRPPARSGKIEVVAIAVSTGGPNALAALLPLLPTDLAVPVVIVQHIPPLFSKALAERLDTKCALDVQEGVSGTPLSAGQVWIAPGDTHLTVHRDGLTTRLLTSDGPPENSCRPAADVLFRSVVATFGAGVLGVVLTGMGSDGLKGCEAVVKAGGSVIAQDEATSVVWGMPGAVTQAGLAEKVLPLDQIAAEIVNRVGTQRHNAALAPPSVRQ